MARTGETRPASWLWLLVLAALIVAAVGVLTAIATALTEVAGTPASFARPTPSPPGPITDLRRIVEEPAPESLVGRRVELTEAAPVGEVLGDTTIWLGDEGERVLVVTADTIGDVSDEVAEGASIRLTGRVEAMPPADDAQTRWGLSADAAAEAVAAGVYIEAEAIQPAEDPAGD